MKTSIVTAVAACIGVASIAYYNVSRADGVGQEQATDVIQALDDNAKATTFRLPSPVPTARGAVISEMIQLYHDEQRDVTVGMAQGQSDEICMSIGYRLDSEREWVSSMTCASASSIRQRGLALEVIPMATPGSPESLEFYLVPDGASSQGIPVGLIARDEFGNLLEKPSGLEWTEDTERSTLDRSMPEDGSQFRLAVLPQTDRESEQ